MWRFAQRHPSALLLAAQLAGILLIPLDEDGHASRALYGSFSVIVIATVVLTVRRSPATTWIAALLGAPAILLRIIQATSGSDALLPYCAAIEAALYFNAAAALIAYMLADHEVTRDELFAVGAAFTLLATGFASLFVACQAITPASFSAATTTNEPRTWIELLLLSFTTLSNIGIGDVIPIKPFARSLVMVEQLAGVTYVALVVSRLVALTVQRRALPAATEPIGSRRTSPPNGGNPDA